MSSFNLDTLAVPFLVILLFTLFVSVKITNKPVLSIVIALIKAGIFVFYFGWIFDGTFTVLDDWTYVDVGRELLRRDIGVTNLSDNWQYLLMIGGGDHFVYYLYNTYAFRLFGAEYFAPVALNVMATVITAGIGARLAATEFSVKGMELRIFYVFLLLHPDILAWSNVINGKDILILLFHVLMLFSVSCYLRGRILTAISVAIPATLVLFFLRFYVPVMFAAALAFSVLAARRGVWKRIRYLMVSLLLILAMLLWTGSAGVQYVVDQLRGAMVNPVFGFIRMLLTPVPFNTEDAYAFLNLSASIHWVLIPFALLGVVVVWRQGSSFSRVFIAYVLLFMGLYAVYGELQGPRHRVQLDYAWAVFQFLGIVQFLKTVLAPHRQSRQTDVILSNS